MLIRSKRSKGRKEKTLEVDDFFIIKKLLSHLPKLIDL